MKKIIALTIFTLIFIPVICFSAGKIEIATGQYGGDFISISKFGENDDVGTSYENVSEMGGGLTYFTTATNIEILSDNVNDTIAGTGARTMTVYSLDGNYNFQKESFSFNGTTPVAGTLPALRVWRAFIDTAGSGGINAGVVTIRGISAGPVQALIVNGTRQANQTATSLFTIPNGYYGLLSVIFTGCQKLDDADIDFQVRPLGGVFQTKHHIVLYQSYITNKFVFPKLIPPKSDIRMRAKSSVASTHVMAGYQLLLIKANRVSLFPNVSD